MKNKFGYDDIPQPIRCRKCQQKTLMNTVAEYAKDEWGTFPGGEDTYFVREIYHLLLCPNCKEPTTVGYYTFGSETTNPSDPDYEEAYDQIYTLINSDNIPNHKTILPQDMVEDTRGYIEKVVEQINITYSVECYDACAVLIRRLIETLIIETYESRESMDQIKDKNGEIKTLDKLITEVVEKDPWNLTRNTKKSLREFKELGDLAAHNRSFITKLDYIEKLIPGLRIVVPDLLSKAKLNV